MLDVFASLPQLLRLRRTFIATGGVLIYTLLCWAGLNSGLMSGDESAFQLLFGVWILGFLVVIASVLADFRLRLNDSLLTYVQVVWGNLGVVCSALLVTDSMRILLLVGTLFGILFAALRLQRKQVWTLALITWGVYSLALVFLFQLSVLLDIRSELFTWVAYTFVLVGAVLLADEVTDLRLAFKTRRDELNQALERLQELALQDDLTGINNRRHLMDYLQRQKALADRGGMGFTLCYADLDYFKQVNDRYGHARGDEVLKAFADIARSAVREIDFVARMGGEEFVLVLINADVEMAKQVAQRLRRQTELLIVAPDMRDFTLTVSTGIAEYQCGERIDDLISRADEALYQAKSLGRNQIVVAGASFSSELSGKSTKPASSVPLRG